ncbi:MAG: hypothetical protein WBG48_07645, partial [Pricia sp.]
FNPSPELMKKVHWANRYSDRVMKLQAKAHKKFMEESDTWGGKRHRYLQRLSNRISHKVYVLARYSSFLTTAALNSK